MKKKMSLQKVPPSRPLFSSPPQLSMPLLPLRRSLLRLSTLPPPPISKVPDHLMLLTAVRELVVMGLEVMMWSERLVGIHRKWGILRLEKVRKRKKTMERTVIGSKPGLWRTLWLSSVGFESFLHFFFVYDFALLYELSSHFLFT